MIKDKLANWCKAVLGGRRKSARGMPPQGKIKTKASRTRLKIASVSAGPEGSPISGQQDILGDFARAMQDLQKAPGTPREDLQEMTEGIMELGAAQRPGDQHLEVTHDCDPGPCRCHLGDTEPMDSEEGAITSEASKIFLRYLEGDLEAAKIVEGWAQKERDRTVGHGARSASPSSRAVDDARHVDDPYASGDGA